MRLVRTLGVLVLGFYADVAAAATLVNAIAAKAAQSVEG
jgi:hypothetical protein